MFSDWPLSLLCAYKWSHSHILLLAWLHCPSLYYIIFRSLSLSLFLPFCRLSFSITDRMHTEYILSSTGSVLKIYSLSQKSYETLLSEYHGSVLALIKANNVNFKRWWSNVWWNCQKVVAALLCVLKLSFSCWRFFFFFPSFSSLRDLTDILVERFAAIFVCFYNDSYWATVMECPCNKWPV